MGPSDDSLLIQEIKTEEETALDQQQASIEQRVCDFRNLDGHIVIDDDDENEGTEDEDGAVNTEMPGGDEEKAEAELRSGIATVIDLTEDDRPSPELDTPAVQEEPHLPSRNLPVSKEDCRSQYVHCGKTLEPGKVVEIRPLDKSTLYQASFLKIQSIISTPSGVVLRGLPFTRTRHLRGQLQRLRNEVCTVLQIDADDDRPDEEQAAVEVPVESIIAIRDLHCTNANFPENRFEQGIYQSISEVEEKGSLTCRWKCRLVYKNADARKRRQVPVEYIIAHLNADDASKDKYRTNDRARVNDWRGDRVRGGSYNVTAKVDINNILDVDKADDMQDMTNTELKWIDKQPGQRYTLGDMFSGAGGTSLGASLAGFHIRLACDHANHACKTHRTNFPDTDLRQTDIYNFIREQACGYVDVLHLSPPCQFWSPAHTIPGVNDEANIAVLFSCHELIKKLRPRVFTLEQTFGILHPRFEHYFNALIHGFTRHSYSIRWTTVNLLNWGLPSRRMRLIMIGSCAGEKLPTFPQPTHAKYPVPGTPLEPYVTVMQAMRKIPPHATMNERKWGPTRKPWDPNIPLARTITTHGGYGNYHFGGKRDFTLREYATMNGFPVRYEFEKTSAKKQIGNAFPPCVVKVLFEHLRKWLENEDRVHPVEEQSLAIDEPDYDIIELSDDDDERKSSWGGLSDVMDIDGSGYKGRGALPCIDPTQQLLQQRNSIIDLTSDSPKEPKSPIDLTNE